MISDFCLLGSTTTSSTTSVLFFVCCLELGFQVIDLTSVPRLYSSPELSGEAFSVPFS